MAHLHTFRFPGESDSYRSTRDELLQAEIDLRRRVEEVAHVAPCLAAFARHGFCRLSLTCLFRQRRISAQ